jgi:hypothetical protein
MGDLQKIMYARAGRPDDDARAARCLSCTKYLWTRVRQTIRSPRRPPNRGDLAGLTLPSGDLARLGASGGPPRGDITRALLILVATSPFERSSTSASGARSGARRLAFGAINVPIVYMSVRWWRTIHQISRPLDVDPAYVPACGSTPCVPLCDDLLHSPPIRGRVVAERGRTRVRTAALRGRT